MDRNLDGFYYRYKDGDRYVNKCFTDLPSEEQDKFLESLEKPGLIRMCKEFAHIIKFIGDTFDIVNSSGGEDDE